jgi:hypothetical protein
MGKSLDSADREGRTQRYVDLVKNSIDRWRRLHPDDADGALLEISEYASERRFEAQDVAARAKETK